MNLETFDRELQRQLEQLLTQKRVRILALVEIGDDDILRERLAESCRGIAHPVIAIFEMTEG